eukprot:GFUD01113893.1.p1 GENE.GFUD01113893.1~~GFUD01113893.1.p1  ORF type:complete len:281 (-),score=64.74 GFUD01113893.1:72-914(-)
MSKVRKQICMVVGQPKGFTRSILEALLKKGSNVLLACPEKCDGSQEIKRLRTLYGPGKVHFSALDRNTSNSLESVFANAWNTFGEICFIVNSSKKDSLQLKTKLEDLESADPNLCLSEPDLMSGLSKMDLMASKYMGKQNGFQGGTLLNVNHSAGTLLNVNHSADLTHSSSLHSPGLVSSLALAGVKTCTVFRPSMDYPDSPMVQITDDQHSPYYQWDKYSSYTRDYTGYMAVHVGQTCAPGTAWAFSKSLQLKEVSRSYRSPDFEELPARQIWFLKNGC